MSEREPIGVIGTGYVGLVTAAGFAELGSEVWCIDIDAEKIRGLEQGRIPIWEPGLEELVARHRERMHFSTDVADALEHARLLFVAVGTPPTYSGDADLSCPEFLKGGSAVRDFLTPDRVVIGDDGDWAGAAVVDLYEPLDAPLVRT